MGYYKVGEIIPELKTGIEIAQIHYRAPFWELAVAYPGITEAEINELTTGNFRLAITTIDECLFSCLVLGVFLGQMRRMSREYRKSLWTIESIFPKEAESPLFC